MTSRSADRRACGRRLREAVRLRSPARRSMLRDTPRSHTSHTTPRYTRSRSGPCSAGVPDRRRGGGPTHGRTARWERRRSGRGRRQWERSRSSPRRHARRWHSSCERFVLHRRRRRTSEYLSLEIRIAYPTLRGSKVAGSQW